MTQQLCHTIMPTIRERNGQYQAQVRIKRGGAIVFQESATFASEKQALLWGLSLEKKLEKSGYAEHTLENTTVAKIIDLHEALLVSINKSTEGYAHGFRALRNSEFGKKAIGVVKSADVTQWAMSYAAGDEGKTGVKQPRAPATVLHVLMTLRSAYRSARTMSKIPTDVMVVADAINELSRLGVVAKSQERDRRVTDEEINLLCKRHEMKFSGVPLRTICLLAIALPRRREELMTMRWDDYKDNTMLLRDTKDPTGVRNELIPVPPLAQTILASLKREDELVLPYKPKTISTSFHRAAELADLEDITFHDLRHEGISRLFEAGLNIPEVSLISGHRSWATLKRYTQLRPAHVLEKLNASNKRPTETAPEPERP